MYAPASLDAERDSWKPIVYLNLIKSQRIILSVLEHEFDLEIDRESTRLLSPQTSHPHLRPFDHDDGEIQVQGLGKGKGKEKMVESPVLDSPILGSPEDDSSPTSRSSGAVPPLWASQIATLRLRLAPLLSMQESLSKKIGMGVQVAPGKEEVFVRTGWQGLRPQRPNHNPNSNYELASTLSMGSTSSGEEDGGSDGATEVQQRAEVIRQVGSLVGASKEDVKELYGHSSTLR